MSEAKPFASLSSGLLARKGAARPAMRPQGWSQQSASLDDLGWNDMGHDETAEADPKPAGDVVDHPRSHHPTGLSPVTSPVHSQQAELADRFADDDDEDYDEEYDETAEPYEPEGDAGKFTGFSFDDEEEEGEPEFRVQFKSGKKPLDLGPAPSLAETADEAMDEVSDDVLDLADAAVVAEPVTGLDDAAFAPLAAALPADEPSEQLSYEPTPEPAFEPPVFTAVQPDPMPVRMPRPRTAPGGKGKAAFTLRLDPQRHLKLRLACAVRGVSAQQLVTDALDSLLGDMPELDHMADQARQRG